MKVRLLFFLIKYLLKLNYFDYPSILVFFLKKFSIDLVTEIILYENTLEKSECFKSVKLITRNWIKENRTTGIE